MQKGLKAAVTSVHVKLPPDLKQLFSECRTRLDFDFKLPSMPTPWSPKNLSPGSVFACFTLRPPLQSFPPRSVPTPPHHTYPAFISSHNPFSRIHTSPYSTMPCSSSNNPFPKVCPCTHTHLTLPILPHNLVPRVRPRHVGHATSVTLVCFVCSALSVNPVNPNLIRTQPPLISTHSLACPLGATRRGTDTASNTRQPSFNRHVKKRT